MGRTCGTPVLAQLKIRPNKVAAPASATSAPMTAVSTATGSLKPEICFEGSPPLLLCDIAEDETESSRGWICTNVKTGSTTHIARAATETRYRRFAVAERRTR